jgi:hypothetical protein
VKIPEHIKEYAMPYTGAAAIVAMLGGTMSVTLPADKSVAELTVQSTARFEKIELQLSQTWEDNRTYQTTQQQYHDRTELRAVDYELRTIAAEIKRLNDLTQYYDIELNAQQRWTLDTLKEDWSRLTTYRLELINQ